MGDDPATPKATRDRPASQPLRSRLGAAPVFVVGLLLACAATWWAVYSYNNDDPQFWKDDVEILIPILALAWGAVMIGRRLMAPDAEKVLEHDKRDPVVYLRPFDEDTRRIDALPVGKRNGGRKIANSSTPVSRERQLAHALKQIGPFVAIGKPGDALAPLGAARLYVADSDWQAKVDALLRRAAAIVLCPETSEGTWWEVMEVTRLVDRRRVLIIVPNPALRPLGYARIQALMQKTWQLPADCESADAFMFDAQGRPQPLVFGRSAASALRAFIDQVRGLPETHGVAA
jgi:hypothetical protein